MNTPLITIAATLLLHLPASAQGPFLFVNDSLGTTNGPFTLSPYASIALDGTSYTLHPVSSPFEFEAHRVPELYFRDAEPQDVLSHALTACGITNAHSGTIVTFRPHTVTRRVTFAARDITLSETIEIVADICDLDIIRDHRAKAVILVPNEISDGRIARVYGLIPPAYDAMVRYSGSLSQVLLEFGVIRKESHVLIDYQRENSILILYASHQVLDRFDTTASPIMVDEAIGQHSPGP